MSIRDQLNTDLVAAMRQGDKFKRDTIRLLLAAIKQVEIDQQTELDDDGLLAVLNKQAKQRRESIRDAEKADRPDLIEEEQKELDLIESYLPQMMSADEIRPIASGVINDIGAEDLQDMGNVMSRVMPQLKGQADGRLVSDVVRELLQS
jgi:hypothetical protein